MRKMRGRSRRRGFVKGVWMKRRLTQYVHRPLAKAPSLTRWERTKALCIADGSVEEAEEEAGAASACLSDAAAEVQAICDEGMPSEVPAEAIGDDGMDSETLPAKALTVSTCVFCSPPRDWDDLLDGQWDGWIPERLYSFNRTWEEWRHKVVEDRRKAHRSEEEAACKDGCASDDEAEALKVSKQLAIA
jgi:hypothetical protein